MFAVSGSDSTSSFAAFFADSMRVPSASASTIDEDASKISIALLSSEPSEAVDDVFVDVVEDDEVSVTVDTAVEDDCPHATGAHAKQQHTAIISARTTLAPFCEIDQLILMRPSSMCAESLRTIKELHHTCTPRYHFVKTQAHILQPQNLCGSKVSSNT